MFDKNMSRREAMGVALKGVAYAAGTIPAAAVPTATSAAPTMLLADATIAIFGGFHNGFASVRAGTQYGFIDKTGALAIPPQFDDVGRFSLGRAPVKMGDKWGFADATGVLVIPASFDDAFNFFPESGLASVRVRDKWGFIDITGALIIPATFDDVGDFAIALPNSTTVADIASPPSPLAPVNVGDRWGYIDRSGAFAIQPQFEKAFAFTADGVAPVTLGGKGYIDMAGKFVVPAQYDDTYLFASEGLVSVQMGNKWGYVSTKTGQVVLPPTFDAAREFSGGVAAVKVSGKSGLVRPDGSFAVPPQFTSLESPDPKGFSLVQTADEKWGFIDRTGMLVTPLFQDTFIFTDGLARAQMDGLYGFIDRTGMFVIPPQFAPNPDAIDL